jgi:hypothetical protein
LFSLFVAPEVRPAPALQVETGGEIRNYEEGVKLVISSGTRSDIKAIHTNEGLVPSNAAPRLRGIGSMLSFVRAFTKTRLRIT